MNDFRTWIRDVVDGRTSIRIEILDPDGVRIGFMEPVTQSTPASDDVMQAMTRWRNLARSSFFTQFEATVPRTRRWLEAVLQAADDRLLFLIYTDTGKLVGQYGFIHMDERSAELDNLIRGETGGAPQLIQRTERTFLKWLFDTFNLETLSGRAFSHNALALRMHYDVGFRSVGRVPLKQTATEGELHYDVVGGDGEPSPDNRYCELIELRREALRR